ncbi:hypothetical protein THASP1DRAFT_31390 [Thamnocephalis sphaerospora]|uniref:Uncharacterized protein n=1 Tax=Thamnocephalis sphaerospora TaxID=78915 RepID=A0A4V1IW97_9FUNG|nr:hypothetical protein THASP1DRAFT_31390 [Thamnocephalis sphaerospora]|eukprot:RKP06799.1 hypothetical protein THASP1DRAFT_31390 [Thamnocephalis sphaerospora]
MNFASMLGRAVAVVVGLVAILHTQQADAHGYMSSPECRGCGATGGGLLGPLRSFGLLKFTRLGNPERVEKLCRGFMTPGKVTEVGREIPIGLTILIAHPGPCWIYLYDENMENPVLISTKENCAAKTPTEPWTAQVPEGISGRKVLRWLWHGTQASPTEKYESCADINISY